jgi:hypothetical protein
MKTKYYKSEIDVIADVIWIFYIIPDEIIETPYFTDKYGLPTSNHNQAVNNLPFKQTLYRFAKTDADFKIVFEKMFSLSGYLDRDIFLERHIEAFQERKNEINQFKAETLGSEHELIVKYLMYLQTNVTTPKPQNDMNNNGIDCHKLLSNLSSYITNISNTEFSNVINNKALSFGCPKAKWIGSKADACRFIVYIGMTKKQFNACFTLKNENKLIAANKDKSQTSSNINNIMKSSCTI